LRITQPSLLILAATIAALAAAVATDAQAHAAGPPLTVLAVQPTELVLAGSTRGTITVTNPGRIPIVIRASTGNYAIAPNGRVQVDPLLPPSRSAKTWLTISPNRFTLAPRKTMNLTVSAKPPRTATRGDHHALVLLETGGSKSGQVAIHTRIGVAILVRVNGPLVRRLRLKSLRVIGSRRNRALELSLANDGNVNERLLRGQVTVTLRRSGRKPVKLIAPPRDLLPGGTGTLAVPYRGTLKGAIDALVQIRPTPARIAGPGITTNLSVIVATFRIRL
jgi:hypothetical protein